MDYQAPHGQPHFSQTPNAQSTEVKNAKYFRNRAWNTLKRKGNLLNTTVTALVYSMITGAVITAVMMLIYVPIFILLALNFASEEFMILLVLVMIGLLFVAIFATMILVEGPLNVGYARVFLDATGGKQPEIPTLFAGFRQGFWKNAASYACLIPISLAATLPMIFAIILGTVFFALGTKIPVLVVLGVITMIAGYLLTFALALVITYRYALIPYLRAEDPQISVRDAFRRSADLMHGNKWRLFCLQFSFIGWVLLLYLSMFFTCGLSAMVGTYLLTAYMSTATAEFYRDLTGTTYTPPQDSPFPPFVNQYSPNQTNNQQ